MQLQPQMAPKTTLALLSIQHKLQALPLVRPQLHSQALQVHLQSGQSTIGSMQQLCRPLLERRALQIQITMGLSSNGQKSAWPALAGRCQLHLSTLAMGGARANVSLTTDAPTCLML